jgi:3-hydroxyacyl-[acyl-carrier-protein] dehydratase
VRFLLVDEILELVPGQRILGLKRIDPEEDYFRDHFPGFPVVPGVLLTEMMAQLGGKCLDAENLSRGKSMLAAIESAKFRQWVRPGEVAIIEAEIKSSRPQYASASCRVRVGERAVASAELFFSFVPAGQFAPAFRDEALDLYFTSRSGVLNLGLQPIPTTLL